MIEDEQPETVERYGDSKFGRSCLVARRLIEAGVSLAMVNWPGHESHFDTDAGHFSSMKNDLLPPSDQGFFRYWKTLPCVGCSKKRSSCGPLNSVAPPR